MGRQRQPEIRERLLAACTDHALEHGLPDRLQPLAQAAGTSTRMLIYHFGTRDDLLREVLRSARRRQRETFEELLRPRDDEPYPTTLGRAWSAMAGPTGRPYLALFGWLRQDAEQQLWPGFAREATTDWLAPLERGLSATGHPGLATVVLAVVRGLVMDLEATGDAARVDRAFADLLDVLAGAQPVRTSPPARRCAPPAGTRTSAGRG